MPEASAAREQIILYASFTESRHRPRRAVGAAEQLRGSRRRSSTGCGSAQGGVPTTATTMTPGAVARHRVACRRRWRRRCCAVLQHAGSRAQRAAQRSALARTVLCDATWHARDRRRALTESRGKLIEVSYVQHTAPCDTYTRRNAEGRRWSAWLEMARSTPAASAVRRAARAERAAPAFPSRPAAASAASAAAHSPRRALPRQRRRLQGRVDAVERLPRRSMVAAATWAVVASFPPTRSTGPAGVLGGGRAPAEPARAARTRASRKRRCQSRTGAVEARRQLPSRPPSGGRTASSARRPTPRASPSAAAAGRARPGGAHAGEPSTPPPAAGAPWSGSRWR